MVFFFTLFFGKRPKEKCIKCKIVNINAFLTAWVVPNIRPRTRYSKESYQQASQDGTGLAFGGALQFAGVCDMIRRNQKLSTAGKRLQARRLWS